MTDKQIIIDGVDVSECEFLNYDNQLKCETCNLSDFDNYYRCNKNPNCYYKQLKRKEQECENLKEANNENLELLIDRTKFIAEIAHKLGINDAIIEKKAIFTKLDQLKTENEELRKNLVDKHTSRCFRLVTHREYNKLIIEIALSRQENSKLKQALEEIEKTVHRLEYRTPLFEMKEIAKDIIAILDIINKAKDGE